jgi:uncharacterized damage-inducible protein DinB
MATDPIAANFLDYSSKRLHLSQQQIARCCDQLTEEQMQHRGGDHENSIVNLLLHLEGNIRQWILHGIADQPDVRQRDAEFTLAPTATAADARARFDATLDEAAGIIAALDPTRLTAIIDPQPTGICRNPTVLEAIYRIVGHLEHHTGQIILLTKQMTATDLDLSLPRKRLS